VPLQAMTRSGAPGGIPGRASRIAAGFLFALASGVGLGQASAATTYYVDFATGADANNGTTKATPWKHAPGMQGCTSNCAGHTPTGGDSFIFKGGVTWDHTCFALDFLGWQGSAGNVIYYGADVTWFTGASFTKPKFDGEYSALPLSGSLFAVESGSKYLTIDNIELTGLMAFSSYGPGLIGHMCAQNLVMSNLFIHGWKLTNTITTDDAHGGVIGNYNRCSTTGNKITHSVISNVEGGAAGRQNGVAIRQTDVEYSTLHDLSSVQLFGLMHDTEVYNVQVPSQNVDFDTNYHQNITYIDLWDGTSVTFTRPALVYNNLIHDFAAGSGGLYAVTCRGQSVYLFNNVVYNNRAQANDVQIDQDVSTGNCGNYYIWNNTFEVSSAGQAAMRQVPRGISSIASLDTRNNQYIMDGGQDFAVSDGVTSRTNSNNVTLTHAQAASQGYATSNNWAPTSGSNSTAGAGTNLTSLCATVSSVLCSATTAGNGMAAVARPPSGAWDVGAYAGSGGGSTGPNPPSSLTVSVR
jgi:hypothetical protein